MPHFCSRNAGPITSAFRSSGSVWVAARSFECEQRFHCSRFFSYYFCRSECGLSCESFASRSDRREYLVRLTGSYAEMGSKWFRNGVTRHHDRLASPQHRFAQASDAAAALRCGGLGASKPSLRKASSGPSLSVSSGCCAGAASWRSRR